MSGKTVTRAQLGEAVYQEVGLSRNESAELLESVLSEMSSALARGWGLEGSPPVSVIPEAECRDAFFR